MFKLSRTIAACAVALAAHVSAVGAQPADYPNRPIRWLLGFPGGGTSDILARAIAEKLTEAWGQTVVIDNRPGASGIIANETAARSAPDGYTILLVSSTYANLSAMGKKLSYDPEKDLRPVTLLADVPNILSVPPSVPVKSVQGLIDLAKSKPGQLNYGTGGTGTGPHLHTELFRLMAGIDVIHIPYKGTPPAVTDLLAGRVQFMMALSPVVMPHVKSGKLVPLGVSGKSRLPDLPNVPTVGETVKGYSATTWYGLLVPAGMSPAITNKLSKEISNILAMPQVKERLASVGFQTEPSNPEQFTRFMREEIAKWRTVIQKAKIEF